MLHYPSNQAQIWIHPWNLLHWQSGILSAFALRFTVKHAASLCFGSWCTVLNLSPLIEALKYNVFCPFGVSLLRSGPQPSTGLMGGSEAPDSISFYSRSLLLTGTQPSSTRNPHTLSHFHPLSPPPFFFLNLLGGQTLPVDVEALCCKALLSLFKCLCMCAHLCLVNSYKPKSWWKMS